MVQECSLNRYIIITQLRLLYAPQDQRETVKVKQILKGLTDKCLRHDKNRCADAAACGSGPAVPISVTVKPFVISHSSFDSLFSGIKKYFKVSRSLAVLGTDSNDYAMFDVESVKQGFWYFQQIFGEEML